MCPLCPPISLLPLETLGFFGWHMVKKLCPPCVPRGLLVSPEAMKTLGAWLFGGHKMALLGDAS